MNELQSLSQIFQNKIFRIPDYQRGYAWQSQQLRDFWEDIVNLQSDRYHYTGLLSLKKLNQEESRKLGNDDSWLLQSGFKAYHIVDGQQRLTTFVIMLNEIIEFTCQLPDNIGKSYEEIYLGFENIKDIKAKYISRKRPPEDLIITYMFGYENDNPSAEYLKYKVLGQEYGGTIKETYYTKNLKYAKEFFGKELRAYYEKKGIEGITDLYRKLTLKLMFNIHEIEDDYDVFVAFETMNNRGKRLTNLELLKNRLIYLTTLYSSDILDGTDQIALRELINKAWSEVYYQLGRNENNLLSDDEFLRAHWIIYYSYSRKRGDDYIKFLLRKFSHKSIFENIIEVNPDEDDPTVFMSDQQDDDDDIEVDSSPKIVTDEFLQPKEIIDYVNSLNETAEYWYYTFYPEKCPYITEEEQVWIEKLNRIGIGYFRPIVAVSLIPRLEYSKYERIAFYKAVERFIFITFRMAMYQSSYKSSDYYRKTHEVYMENMSLSDVTEDLINTTNENAADAVRVFVTRMNKRFISQDGFYSWRELRYFLYEYEYSLASKYKLDKLSWADLTKVVKDKITVEHILPQTPTKLYWRNNFRQFTPEEIKTLSASLGNMLPLSQSINSKLQNDSFDDKKARGYSNGCHCEIEISKEDSWDAKHIYDRGMKLLSFMETRWDFKFEDTKQKEELLHVSFVNDGRDMPPEITDENISDIIIPSDDENVDARDHVTALIMGWAGVKDETGEIHLNPDCCTKLFTRFTTDVMSRILPDAKDARSGWETRNHYFYEIVNEDEGKLYLKMALSAENIPEDLKAICEIISEHFPPRRRGKNWRWRVPFSTKRVDVSKSTDEEVICILNDLYTEAMQFEKQLVDVMKE
ncbi:DUF262 domain-containing protein [Methanobrevibacter smithii]|uniref:DUF262 domain-containing protein n=1 Tax=Methanobrevibacter smithii TaxID=2173 RepID=UPI0037DD3C53